MTLLEALQQADEQITAIHRTFGAPGDYGYETREGKALLNLYQFQAELRAAIKVATDVVNALVKTRTNLEGLSRSDDDVFAAMVRRLDGAASIAGSINVPQPATGK